MQKWNIYEPNSTICDVLYPLKYQMDFNYSILFNKTFSLNIIYNDHENWKVKLCLAPLTQVKETFYSLNLIFMTQFVKQMPLFLSPHSFTNKWYLVCSIDDKIKAQSHKIKWDVKMTQINVILTFFFSQWRLIHRYRHPTVLSKSRRNSLDT